MPPCRGQMTGCWTDASRRAWKRLSSLRILKSKVLPSIPLCSLKRMYIYHLWTVLIDLLVSGSMSMKFQYCVDLSEIDSEMACVILHENSCYGTSLLIVWFLDHSDGQNDLEYPTFYEGTTMEFPWSVVLGSFQYGIILSRCALLGWEHSGKGIKQLQYLDLFFELQLPPHACLIGAWGPNLSTRRYKCNGYSSPGGSLGAVGTAAPR